MNHLLLKQDLGTGHPSRSTYFFKHKMDQIELLHIHRLGRIPLSRSAFRIAWLSQRSGKDAKERSCLQIPDSRAFIDSDNILKKNMLYPLSQHHVVLHWAADGHMCQLDNLIVAPCIEGHRRVSTGECL